MISYRPLFKTMSEKNITSYALFKNGFSKATYYSIKKGNSISTNTVNQLCRLLNCSVSDIIEYIDDPNTQERITDSYRVPFYLCKSIQIIFKSK